MSRTNRNPYTKAKAYDASCRCHGGCPVCEGNRLHSDRKRERTADEQIEEYEERAAILEYDGGMTRKDAEKQAEREIRERAENEDQARLERL